MGAMVSQITSLTIFYSTLYSGAALKKTLRVTGLYVGNSPVTGEFPAQMASKRISFPFDDGIIIYRRESMPDWCLVILMIIVPPKCVLFDTP